jgi:hypothetical protein
MVVFVAAHEPVVRSSDLLEALAGLLLVVGVLVGVPLHRQLPASMNSNKQVGCLCMLFR